MDLDVASKVEVCDMRVMNFKVVAFVALAMFSFSGPASASDSYRYGACRLQADQIANSYMAGYLEPARDAELAPKGSYVFIGAGQKFIVPLRQTNNGDLHLRGTGELMLKRASIYQEELTRCLGILRLRVVSETSISGQLY